MLHQAYYGLQKLQEMTSLDQNANQWTLDMDPSKALNAAPMGIAENVRQNSYEPGQLPEGVKKGEWRKEQVPSQYERTSLVYLFIYFVNNLFMIILL